jgi:hypothetical protein
MIVAITRQDRSAADLRQAAGRTPDAKVARRMLAIALVLEGCSRTDAAETCAMDRQTLRDETVQNVGGSGSPATVWAFGAPFGSSMVPIERAVHHRGSNLQHQMGPARRPAHLLTGAHPPMQ